MTEGVDDKNSVISKESPVVHNGETFINVAAELLTFKVILVFRKYQKKVLWTETAKISMYLSEAG